MNLFVVRASQPSVTGGFRIEQPLVMMSLYDTDNNRLYIRSTPIALEHQFKRMLARDEIQNGTRVTFIYRHGRQPEGVVLTVGEFCGWLAHAVTKMNSARTDWRSKPTIDTNKAH